jgi:hypothetical protein
MLYYAPPNVARIGPLGVLIESARTNYLLQSQALATAPWTVAHVTVADPTVTNNTADVLAPDGSQTATKIELPAVGAGEMSSVQQTFTGADYKWSGSIWLRTTTGTATVYLHMLVAGTVYTTTCNVTSTWTRFTLPNVTLTAATWTYELGIDCVNGDSAQSAQTIYAWGGQCEAGTSVSSYITTTTGGQVRPVDSVTVSNPLRTEDSTWIIDGIFTKPEFASDTFSGLWAVGNYSAANSFSAWVTSGTNISFIVFDQTATNKAYYVTISPLTGEHRITIAQIYNTARIWLDGVEQSVSVSGAGTGVISDMGSVLNIGVGVGLNYRLNGYVRDFKVARHADISRL